MWKISSFSKTSQTQLKETEERYPHNKKRIKPCTECYNNISKEGGSRIALNKTKKVTMFSGMSDKIVPLLRML